jgi:hypothetical protein
MTVHAIIRFFHGGGVVTLGVELGGKFEDVPGAEFNTISASLAPIFQDVYNTGGNLNFFRIKRNPPKYHRTFSQFRLNQLGPCPKKGALYGLWPICQG